MFYQAELDFFMTTLRKLHLQALLLTSQSPPPYPPDFGLRAFLGREAEYRAAFTDFAGQLREKTIYKLTDAYRCSYIFLLLPESAPPSSLMIGPFLTEEIDRQEMYETAERFGLPPGTSTSWKSIITTFPLSMMKA